MELLIASFFLLVGAEIRNELEHKKELSRTTFCRSWWNGRTSNFLQDNATRIPSMGAVMPTDITLALAVIALLGKRIDPKLRLFVLALAVADDFLSLIAIWNFLQRKIEFSYFGFNNYCCQYWCALAS
jgi:NhaA family Na+:H+ antiporter